MLGIRMFRSSLWNSYFVHVNIIYVYVMEKTVIWLVVKEKGKKIPMSKERL